MALERELPPSAPIDSLCCCCCSRNCNSRHHRIRRIYCSEAEPRTRKVKPEPDVNTGSEGRERDTNQNKSRRSPCSMQWTSGCRGNLLGAGGKESREPQVCFGSALYLMEVQTREASDPRRSLPEFRPCLPRPLRNAALDTALVGETTFQRSTARCAWISNRLNLRKKRSQGFLPSLFSFFFSWVISALSLFPVQLNLLSKQPCNNLLLTTCAPLSNYTETQTSTLSFDSSKQTTGKPSNEILGIPGFQRRKSNDLMTDGRVPPGGGGGGSLHLDAGLSLQIAAADTPDQRASLLLQIRQDIKPLLLTSGVGCDLPNTASAHQHRFHSGAFSGSIREP